LQELISHRSGESKVTSAASSRKFNRCKHSRTRRSICL